MAKQHHKPTPPPKAPPPPPPVHSEAAVNVHLAEFNALTQRLTYWITLMYAVWPIILIFVGMLAQLWSIKPPTVFTHTVLTWVGLIVGHLALMSYFIASWEINNIVRYIEVTLKPMVRRQIPDLHIFWLYEPQLALTRGAGFDFQDTAPALASAIVTIFVGRYVPIKSTPEQVLAVIGGITQVLLLYLAWKSANCRKSVAQHLST